jgi:hypothetical protein
MHLLKDVGVILCGNFMAQELAQRLPSILRLELEQVLLRHDSEKASENVTEQPEPNTGVDKEAGAKTLDSTANPWFC